MESAVLYVNKPLNMYLCRKQKVDRVDNTPTSIYVGSKRLTVLTILQLTQKNTHTSKCIGHLKENRHPLCVLTHWLKEPTLPQNHLWCDTCWPLDGQPRSRVYLIHVLVHVQALERLKFVRHTMHSNHLNHSSSAGAETLCRKCSSHPGKLYYLPHRVTDRYISHHISMAICSHATFHTHEQSLTLEFTVIIFFWNDQILLSCY